MSRQPPVDAGRGAPAETASGLACGRAPNWAGRGSPAAPGVMARRRPTESGHQDVRKYKRKHARNPDKRMAAAVRLRARGLSLREIAAELACSHQTVVRDLERWEKERPNVVPLSHLPVTSSPPGGQKVTGKCDSPTNIVELRRKA